MKRILILAPSLSARTGGIATVSQSLLRMLGEKKREGLIEIKVLSLLPSNDASENAQLNDAIGNAWKHFDGNRIRFAIEAISLARGWADLTLSLHINLSQLQALVPKRRGQKWITLLYGTDVWSPLSPLKRLALSKNPSIAISSFTIKKCQQYNPWFQGAEVCHLGVSPTPLGKASKDWETELGFIPSKKDILIVGRMLSTERQKGHNELLSAMPLVLKSAPATNLIVVGEGDDLEHYRQWVKDADLQKNIYFTGYLSATELADLYEKCGVFCLPGKQEGFGLVYLEAMRAGLPCVATQADAACEIIKEGETGFLVDSSNNEALAQSLLTLVSDEALRDRMGSAGKTRFENQFTEKKFHDQFWEILKHHLAL